MNVMGHLHVPAALLQGKRPLLLWYRGLGDPQSQSECCDKEKYLLPIQGMEPQFLGNLAVPWSVYWQQSELVIFTSGITSSLQYTNAAVTTTSLTFAEKGWLAFVSSYYVDGLMKGCLCKL